MMDSNIWGATTSGLPVARPRHSRTHDVSVDHATSGSTVGCEKNYDTVEFIASRPECAVRQIFFQSKTDRRSAIDARTSVVPSA